MRRGGGVRGEAEVLAKKIGRLDVTVYRISNLGAYGGGDSHANGGGGRLGLVAMVKGKRKCVLRPVV